MLLRAMLDLQSKLDDIRQSRMEPPADGDATASGKGSKKKRKKGASGAGSEDDGFINDDALVYDRTGGKARGGAEYVEQEDPQVGTWLLDNLLMRCISLASTYCPCALAA